MMSKEWVEKRFADYQAAAEEERERAAHHDTAILRVVKGRAETKKELSSLQAELKKAVTALSGFVNVAQHCDSPIAYFRNAANAGTLIAVAEDVQSFIVPELLQQVQRMAMLELRLQSLDDDAKQIGID